ncbi:MAG: endoribonuclease MazF [Candidatus Sulfotelmatobacter sp.]
MRYLPDTGHVIKIDLDPVAGHEQGGWRPAIVLSPSPYNKKTGLVVAVPVTNQVKGYPFEVRLPSQMKTTGVVLADQIKNLDWHACRAKYVETAPADVLKAIHERVVLLLGIVQS